MPAREPMPGKPAGSEQPQAGRCASKLRNSLTRFGAWRYCTQRPLASRTRCKLHGGSSPRGPLSTSYKHGRDTAFSRSVPSDLATAYNEGRTPEQLLSLDEEIRLTKALQVEALQAMNAGDIEKLLGEGPPAAEDVREGIATADVGLIQRGAQVLANLFTDDLTKRAAGARRVRELFEQRRRLVDTERKLEEFTRAAMSAEQVLALMRGISDIITDEVGDRDALGRIQDRILQLTTEPLGLRAG